MADPRRFQTRFSDDSDTSDDERREPGYNPVAVRSSSDRDVVQTYNNNNGADNQLATGSAVNAGDFHGPAQIGGKNTIVHKTIINNYFQTPCHPSHHHGNSSSHHLPCQCQICLHSSHHSNSSTHIPCHCQKCLDYHDNDHRTLAEHHPPPSRPDLQHSGLPPAPQLLPPSPQQTAQVESTDRRGNDMPRAHKHDANGFTQLQHKLRRQLSSEARPSQSDVTHHVTWASQEERREEKTAVKTKVSDVKKTGKSQTTQAVPKSAETRPGDDPPVSIIDSQRRELQPGDVVWTSSVGYTIYVGDMDLVWCERRGRQVEKEKLTMTEPFSKATITRSSCEIFPPRERVARAESLVGKEFKVGDGRLCGGGEDFVAWVCTGQTCSQASRSGFRLQR